MTELSLTNPIRAWREDRAWLHAKGPDAQRFLNGMWTCDLARAAKNLSAAQTATATPGFLLDAKGKAIGWGVILAVAADDFWISVPRASSEAVFNALDRLLIADELTLTADFAADQDRRAKAPFHEVWTAPQSGVEAAPLAPDVPTAKDTLFAAPAAEWGRVVPRGDLGSQHVELWVTGEAPSITELSPAERVQWHIRQGRPAWGIDLKADDLILEFPTQAEISFHKGCYIGQEVVARATYRGKMTRGFARFTGPDPLQLGFVYVDSDLERPVGKITTADAVEGLGLIRLTAVSSPLVQQNEDGRLRRISKVELLAE